MHANQAPGARHIERETMRKIQNQGDNDGNGNRARIGDRRQGSRRAEDLERRLADVEDLARANRRELQLQFQRMAQMQADLDRLLKPAHSMPAHSRPPDGTRGVDRDISRSAIAHDGAPTPASRRRRS